jgi:hypothetical protein
MKVGDLVRCMTVDGNPVGLVMSKHIGGSSSFLIVLISGVTACFQPRQLEVINESR